MTTEKGLTLPSPVLAWRHLNAENPDKVKVDGNRS